MATTVAAMRGRLGDTEYYVLSMKAQELVTKITIPKKMPEWNNLSIEERYQRDINYRRVKDHIAPYLANDKSRFFGAVIVTAMNFGDVVSFEPLSEIATKGLPGLYRTAASNMGFLTFSGEEVLVPLDGQHRLKAIEFAVSGRDEEGNDLPNVEPCMELAKEDITVILVAFEQEKARKIFTKVNRYAKATTTGQNIVTEEDDIVAILTREVANEFIGGGLAKFRNNTLARKDREFTTLGIVYNCNLEIITRNFFAKGRPDTSHLPDLAQQKLWRMKVREVWEAVVSGIEVFADALADKEESGDSKRRDIRDSNLLGRPVVQECLVKAYLRLTDAPNNMSSSAACERLNQLPWELSERNLETWQHVLWAGGVESGKIITKNRTLTTRMIAYLAGDQLADPEKLLKDYQGLFPEGERRHRQLPSVS